MSVIDRIIHHWFGASASQRELSGDSCSAVAPWNCPHIHPLPAGEEEIAHVQSRRGRSLVGRNDLSNQQSAIRNKQSAIRRPWSDKRRLIFSPQLPWPMQATGLDQSPCAAEVAGFSQSLVPREWEPER